MKKYFFLFTAVIFYNQTYAQQAFNSSGGNGSKGNFTLDWSVGEMTLIKTENAGNLTFTQGLLQGKLLIFNSSSVISDGELKLFPNPTPGILYLQTGFLQTGKLAVLLYNAAGQLLINREETVSGFSTKNINLSSYASGIFMLKINFVGADGNSRSRTYKIVKL